MKIIFSISIVYLLYVTVVGSDDVLRFDRSENEDKGVNLSYSMCPNNRTKCSETGTCCKTKHNGYHCCRYEKGVCCSDRYHCCPHGSTCDLDKKRCNRNIDNTKMASVESTTDTMEWVVKKENDGEMTSLSHPDMDNKQLTSEATCPNNKTKCKDTKTCCITKHGNYYCCPHKNAVCCSDKWLCCPEGNTCDIKNKKCLDSSITKYNFIKLSKKQEPQMKETYNKNFLERFVGLFLTWETDCNDPELSCHVGEKCCAMQNGKFGCCNDKEGVCDIKSNSCVAKASNHMSILKSDKLSTDICPDNKTDCYSWQTCCPIGNGGYGCCPNRNATCCADQQSCCPYNSKCDMVHSQCIPLDASSGVQTHTSGYTSVVKRRPLQIFLSDIGLNTTCSDNDKCKMNNTCCPIKGGRHGCCSYNSGVCCSDMTSCCPIDTKCGLDGCVGI